MSPGRHGDSICKGQSNTIECIWAGLRNFLRPLRGVSKRFLDLRAALFAQAHNLKVAIDHFSRAFLGDCAKKPLEDDIV